jgi:serine/threonine-protein kinase
LQQNSYMVDIRRDPYVLGPIGCKGVRELIMAVHDRPSTETSNCDRGLTFVPDMTGMKRAAARSLADGQGLNFQWEYQAAQPGQEVDHVVDQVPAPGVQVPIEDPVRVFIARNVPLVRVPEVTGLNITEAAARLEAMKFRVVIEDGAKQTGAADGEVIGQDVRADSPEPRRSVITLAVVGHSGGIPVPHLRGLTLASARDVLRREGLRVESERQNGAATTRDDDRVVDTDIPAGKLVPPGATITALTARRPAS